MNITTQTTRISEALSIAQRRDALLRIQAELARIAQDDKRDLFIVANNNPVLANDAAVTADVIALMMAGQAEEMYNVMLTVVQNEISASNDQILDELDEDRNPQQP